MGVLKVKTEYGFEAVGRGSGGGLTANERSTLIAIVNAIGAFRDTNGQELVEAFNTAWGNSGEGGGGTDEPDTPDNPVTTYTVTNNLTNVTNSNAQTEVTEGFYSATLTVADGYTMHSVVITMGGVDITADVYGDGGILITEVTGDIVITAVAGSALAYALPEPLTFAGDGNAVYDTGYAMYPDGDKDISVCVDFSCSDAATSNTDVITSGVGYGFKLWHGGDRTFRVSASAGDAGTAIGVPFENARLVWRKEKGEAWHYAYALKDGAVAEYTGKGYGYFPEASETTVKIGATVTNFKATIHDFRVYDQFLSNAQIEAYLNGGDI